jgi:hypothetical protein
MLPTFSLRWLLIAIAEFGLGLAALMSESGPLAELFHATIWLAFAYSAIAGMTATGPLRVRSQGFLVAGAAYLLCASFQDRLAIGSPAPIMNSLLRPIYAPTIPTRAAEKAREAGGVATPVSSLPERDVYQLGPAGLIWSAWAESWIRFQRCAHAFVTLMVGCVGAYVAQRIVMRTAKDDKFAGGETRA